MQLSEDRPEGTSFPLYCESEATTPRGPFHEGPLAAPKVAPPRGLPTRLEGALDRSFSGSAEGPCAEEFQS